MKFFILFLSVVSYAQAQDLTGTWSFSGAGCRNATSLSADSHVSIPHAQISTRSAIFTFTKNNVTAIMVDYEGKAQSATFGYSVRNNKVILNGPEYLPDVYIQGDDTLISVNQGYSSVAIQSCCNYEYIENWRDFKRRLPEQWEEELKKHGWDENKLIANDKEWEEAKVKCREQDNKVIVQVIRRTD